jgi:hypothetical protein
VTQKHIVESDVDIWLQAPGPRIIEVFKAIKAAVAAQ